MLLCPLLKGVPVCLKVRKKTRGVTRCGWWCTCCCSSYRHQVTWCCWAA